MTQSGQCSVTEAATLLGVSRRTILRRIAAGELLADKLGDNTSAWVVNRADALRLAAKRIHDRAAS